MSDSVVSVSPDEYAAVAARLLYRHNIGAVPVCTSDGRLRGIVTDRDIVLRCVAAENDPATTTVREIMTKSTVTVTPGDDIREAARAMAQAQLRRLPVVSDGKLVGIISLGDMARTREYDMEAALALSEISDNVRRM
jgi:CBS domain-containing protein